METKLPTVWPRHYRRLGLRLLRYSYSYMETRLYNRSKTKLFTMDVLFLTLKSWWLLWHSFQAPCYRSCCHHSGSFCKVPQQGVQYVLKPGFHIAVTIARLSVMSRRPIADSFLNKKTLIFRCLRHVGEVARRSVWNIETGGTGTFPAVTAVFRCRRQVDFYMTTFCPNMSFILWSHLI